MDQAVAQQAEHAESLARLAVDLNSRTDLDWIYRTACERITGSLAVDSAFLVLFNETSRSYQLVKALQDEAWQPVDLCPIFRESTHKPDILKIGSPSVVSKFQVKKYFKGHDCSSLNLPAIILLATLYHNGTKIGVLGAGTHDPKRLFSNEEINFVQTFADQVASACAHARLFEAVKEQALFLQLSNAVTRITLDNADLEETLDLLAKKVVDILPVEGCSILLWDQRKNIFSPHAAAGPNTFYLLSASQPSQETSILKSALEAGQVRFVQGRQSAPEITDKGNSYLVLPMQNSARKIGAILIENPNMSGGLIAVELRHWEEIASQITLAITNILSIEQEIKHRQEAELLQQATVTVATSLDLQEVLNQILTSLKKVVPFDSAAICLIENEHLRIAAQGGSAWHFREVGDRIEKSAGLFSLLEAARTPIYLADAQLHPNYQQWSAEGKSLIHAWMGVPLIAYDHPIGYLLLNSQEEDLYTADHARLAQAFVSQAAVAIEKARLFEQVRNGRERLRTVSKKMVEIHEEERRFIAHELHDEIGQELTGLQFLLEMCKDGDETTKLQALAETQELVRSLMSQVRELSINLHPSMLDDLGLLPALKSHFMRFQQKTGIHVHFNHHNLERRFSPDLEVSVFRVVQEALTNTARYARVKELNVKISTDTASLKIEISDYGQGFDTQILQDSSHSFGIAGMRERTELAGGKFDIQSSPGHGTWIVAVFPNGIKKVERRKSDRPSLAGR